MVKGLKIHFTFAEIGLSFFFFLSRVLQDHPSSHQLKYGSVLKQRGLTVHRATRLTMNRQSRCANLTNSHVSLQSSHRCMGCSVHAHARCYQM